MTLHRIHRRWGAVVAAAAFALCVLPARAAAQEQPQPQQQPPPGPLDQPGVTPAEIQRMFDAYALMQAQEQLKISDEQFSQFLTKFKTLQDVRRRGQNQRGRMLMDLRNLLNNGGDEAQIRDRLKGLTELETKTAEETRTAQQAVDLVLNVQQQARFRLFEEQMERRKLELLTRARQANRPKPNQKDQPTGRP